MNTPAHPRILLIDDDRKLCGLLKTYLEPMGYDIVMAHTGNEGLERAHEADIDAVILDVMLPEMDGFEVLTRLRRRSQVPVLMLTGRGEEADRIVGLEIGADDYLPKTFSSRELLARLRAVLRRRSPAATQEELQEVLSCHDLHINLDAREVDLAGETLELTPLEFELLADLMKARGRVRSREQLLDSVADRNYDVFDRSIDVHISSLRRKLKDDAKTPRYIRTVRSVGYMFLTEEIES